MITKRAKLRAIDAGTRYDVAGKLKRLAREIERGEHGDVRDVVLAIRSRKLRGGVEVVAHHFGTDTIEGVLYTWECARKIIT